MRALTRRCSSSGRQLCDLAMINDLYVVRFQHWRVSSRPIAVQPSHPLADSDDDKGTDALMINALPGEPPRASRAQLLARQRCCPNADGGANWLTCLLPKLGNWHRWLWAICGLK